MLGQNIRIKEIPVIPLDLCIAKTSGDSPGASIETHCTIVAFVARELITLFPCTIQKTLFPEGTDFIAGLHDIGKASPSFQKMIYEHVSSEYQTVIHCLADVNPDLAKRSCAGFHAAVSQVTLEEAGNHIPEIAGMHHGFTPSTGNLMPGNALHGGQAWQNERQKLVEKLRETLSYPINFWPQISEIQAGIIAGLVTVADWIGSGDFFAEYTRDFVPSYSELQSICSKAIAAAGFRRAQVIHGLTFQDIFPFQPNTVQSTLIAAANTPGLYILEAPMGIGKTEAALYTAYRLLESEQATGVYFALPTQLTSEKIFERMCRFLDCIIDPSTGISKVHLLHGASWLKETGMGADGDTGGSWFDSTKRGILAPFAAGTIDQALMAVMNVRHGFVRTFGLAGKVVILDEVHSYDSFTGTIVNKLVTELLQIHCTVIILSATLTENQKNAFLDINLNNTLSPLYPLVSAKPNEKAGAVLEFSCAIPDTDVVTVRCSTKLDECIDEALEQASAGQQVLWIENTVQEAQDVFRCLSARCSGTSVDCGLLHSRFLSCDRQRIEDKWVSLYGKSGYERRKETGRILVGTQVLEQSIDIDSDFLVTRICPTDMLLQRTGRLWRHRINDELRKCCGAKREVLILAPNLNEAQTKPGQFGKSGMVYSEYVLLRTLEIWNQTTAVSIPEDIRSLIERTYQDRHEEGLAAHYKHLLVDKKDSLQRLARLGLSKGIQTLPETKASTRYSEQENVEVLLLSKKVPTDHGMLLVFLDGSSIDVSVPTTDRAFKREVAIAIKQNSIKVADYLAPDVSTGFSMFKDFVYTGSRDDGEEPFRVALVSRDTEITGLDTSRANKTYLLLYDSISGYQCEKYQEIQ